MPVEMTYDPEADAIYIRLSDERLVEAEGAGPLTLDYTTAGRVRGIEILAASQILAPGAWSRAKPPTGAAEMIAAE